jgi:hypothetical protein
MSDESQVSPVVANAQQALAMKELGGRIDGLGKQVRALWVTVIVVGLIALVAAMFTLLPRIGIRMGGGQFSGRTGTFNGQQVPQNTPAQ